MYRLEVRYKLLQAFLVMVSFSFVAIYQLKWNFFPLVSLGLILLFALLLLAESRHIKILSDYMQRIERYIDWYYRFSICGWEIESRSKTHEKVWVSSLLAGSAALFTLILYSVFAFAAAGWFQSQFPKICLKIPVIDCKWQYFSILLVPLFLVALFSLISLISAWEDGRE